MRKSVILALILVMCTVMLGLASAWILKEVSMQSEPGYALIVFAIILVAFVNLSRFVLWGYIHNHYPISLSYPFNSLFFPMVMVMGYFYGEDITVNRMAGVALITAGVALLAYEYKNGEQ